MSKFINLSFLKMHKVSGSTQNTQNIEIMQHKDSFKSNRKNCDFN